MKMITLILFAVLLSSSVLAMKVISPYPIVSTGTGGSCSCTANSTFNQTYTDTLYLRLDTSNDPLIDDLDVGNNNLYLNGTILFRENTSGGTKELLKMDHVGGDGMSIDYDYDFEDIAFNDWLLIKKTDGNEPDGTADGGVAVVFYNNLTNRSWTALKIDGYGLANFTNTSIVTTTNVTAPNLCYSDGSNCIPGGLTLTSFIGSDCNGTDGQKNRMVDTLVTPKQVYLDGFYLPSDYFSVAGTELTFTVRVWDEQIIEVWY